MQPNPFAIDQADFEEYVSCKQSQQKQRLRMDEDENEEQEKEKARFESESFRNVRCLEEEGFYFNPNFLYCSEDEVMRKNKEYIISDQEYINKYCSCDALQPILYRLCFRNVSNAKYRICVVCIWCHYNHIIIMYVFNHFGFTQNITKRWHGDNDSVYFPCFCGVDLHHFCAGNCDSIRIHTKIDYFLSAASNGFNGGLHRKFI